MATTTRAGLKQYCFRELGYPVVQINVADEQVEDRIDEALEYFTLYHYEGVEKMYLTHQITCSALTINEVNAAAFVLESTVTGSTSGAMAMVQTNKVNNTVRIRNVVGTFLAGETITSPHATATLAATNFYIAGDTENGWIPIPDAVYGVSRVLPIKYTGNGDYIFDIQYQMTVSGLQNLVNADLTYYHQVMSHLSLIDFELNTTPDFEFNRLQSRLRLDVDWKRKMHTDMFLALECNRALDPVAFGKVFNEPLLKKYTCALIKRQWSVNLSKYSGMQLPGGIVIDGKAMYREAMQEIQEIEEDIRTKSAPLGFMMG